MQSHQVDDVERLRLNAETGSIMTDEVGIEGHRRVVAEAETLAVDGLRIEKIAATVVERTARRPCVLVVEITHIIIGFPEDGGHQHIGLLLARPAVAALQREDVAHGRCRSIGGRGGSAEDDEAARRPLVVETGCCGQRVAIEAGMMLVERFAHHEHHHGSLFLFRRTADADVGQHPLHIFYLMVFVGNKTNVAGQLVQRVSAHGEG